MAKYTLEDLLSKYENRLLSEPEKVKRVIPTGVFSLDIATDVGGIPKGRLTTIYGEGGAGKTTVAMHIVKSAINLGERVLYMDVESTLDIEYLCKITGRSREELKDRLVIISDTDSGKLLQNLFQMVEIGLFDIIILDSVGALVSVEEVKKDVDQKTVAGIARILSPFLRKTMPYVLQNDIALVFINQVRDNIGNPFSQYRMPGGNVLNHASSVIIKLSPNTKIKNKDSEVVGQWTKAIVEKNKVGVPYRNVKFPIIYGEGVDRVLDVFQFALDYNIVKRRGGYYYFFDPETGEGMQIGRGLDGSVEKLRDDDLLLSKIANQVKQIFQNN